MTNGFHNKILAKFNEVVGIVGGFGNLARKRKRVIWVENLKNIKFNGEKIIWKIKRKKKAKILNIESVFKVTPKPLNRLIIFQLI